MGVRQVELYVFADPEDGIYAQRNGALLSNDQAFLNQSEMLKPGFKVLQVQDVDYRTSCFRLVSCLH